MTLSMYCPHPYIFILYLHTLTYLLIKENDPLEKYDDGWDYLEKLLNNINII